MTGNTVKLGVDIADADWSEALLFAGMLGGFFLGSLLAWSMSSRKLRKQGSFR
jgi:uncharacterized membrane protein YoaK (UPF0700 family)